MLYLFASLALSNSMPCPDTTSATELTPHFAECQPRAELPPLPEAATLRLPADLPSPPTDSGPASRTA